MNQVDNSAKGATKDITWWIELIRVILAALSGILGGGAATTLF